MQIAAQYMGTQDLNRPDSTDNWFKNKLTFARIAQSPRAAPEFSRCIFIYCNREEPQRMNAERVPSAALGRDGVPTSSILNFFWWGLLRKYGLLLVR